MSQKEPLPIVVVGTGHHFQRNLVPVLSALEHNGVAELLATVDILGYGEKGSTGGARHIKRNHQPLSSQLKPFKEMKPLVVLGHTNSLHGKDAFDLLSHGYSVAIEKPYTHTAKALDKVLLVAKKNRCALLEYYLTMKSVPLFHGFGSIDPKSFYYTESLLQPLPALQNYASSLGRFRGQIKKIVGEITHVEVEVLEGEGETGTLEGRGVDTIDSQTGGGMILCMMIHALAPLIALEEHIGTFSPKKNFKVRKARCREYVRMAQKRFALPVERIAETYAEVSFLTSKHIPVVARVGKYVFNEQNRRGIKITGKKDEIYIDWNSCTLFVNDEPVIEMKKDYYPVIRAAVAEVEKEPLFLFDSFKSLARAQRMVFMIRDSAYKDDRDVYYDRHADPADIFVQKESETGERVDEEALRPEDNHNTWLKILGDELPGFFPVKQREHSKCPGCGSDDVESEFLKLGFIYKWCGDCYSLYVSPRPREADVDAFYKDSHAMRFYADHIFKATFDARYQHQITPLAEWLRKTMPKRIQSHHRMLDFMPKFYSVWSEVLPHRLQENVSLVDPVHLYKMPASATTLTFPKARKQQYDFVTAFDVLEHRANPGDTIKALSGLCAKDGMLFLTLNAGGFEYQVLGQDSHRLVPPSRLNLLTVEALTLILEKHNFEIIDITSSGKLDVDIVLKALSQDRSKSVARFFSYLLQKRGPEVSEALQGFLQEHNLSSFVRVAARKR